MTERQRRMSLVAVLVVALTWNARFVWSVALPGRFYHRFRSTAADVGAIKEAFINRIPRDASLIVTPDFSPRLLAKRRVHVIESQDDWRSQALDDRQYALVDFLVLNRLGVRGGSRPPPPQHLQDFLTANQWGLMAVVDHLGLFKKGVQTSQRLYEVLATSPQVSAPTALIGETLLMQGCRPEQKAITPGNTIHMSIVWECLRAAERDYWLALRLVDQEGRVLHVVNHPICYGMRPTSLWKNGETIQEHLWILVPSWAPRQTPVWLKGLMLAQPTEGPKSDHLSVIPVESTSDAVFDTEGWLTLGSFAIGSSMN